LTPVEVVRERYKFPHELHDYQNKEVCEVAPLPRVGMYWEPGVGKTTGATHKMLYERLTQGVSSHVVLMPPILLDQWREWLSSIIDKDTGKPLSVTVYAGLPKKREKLPLNSNFTLISYGIFKNDFEKLYDAFHGPTNAVAADEATAIKNVASDTHRAVSIFSEGKNLQLLTGTPVNKPGDAYAYVKLVAPGVYRNQRHFNRLHVKEFDEYGNVKEWMNLDLLAQNMKINASRILRREVRSQLPEVIYTPIKYSLAPSHLALYRRIAEERLVDLDSGGQLDAISASKMRSQLQQIVLNWGAFAEDPSLKASGLDLLDTVMEEIGDKKLVVVANFRRSNAMLLEQTRDKYGTVAIYGDVTPSARTNALREFIHNDRCRMITLQPDSAGFGVDGLQKVCSDMLVLEAPTTPTPFTQVVARLDRDGQQDVVNCRVAMARGTVQVRMFGDLLKKDALANSVQGSFKDLKEAIFGDE
jgi:SNF2 family DNA or RNA helicase